MSRPYRLKRSRLDAMDESRGDFSSSAPLTRAIPVHPDANYRPIPTKSIAAPQARAVINNSPVIVAPLAAGGGGFSPWWILAPLLGLLAALALGLLAYRMKKRADQAKANGSAHEPTRENPAAAAATTTNEIIEKKEIKLLSSARPDFPRPPRTIKELPITFASSGPGSNSLPAQTKKTTSSSSSKDPPRNPFGKLWSIVCCWTLSSRRKSDPRRRQKSPSLEFSRRNATEIEESRTSARSHSSAGRVEIAPLG